MQTILYATKDLITEVNEETTPMVVRNKEDLVLFSRNLGEAICPILTLSAVTNKGVPEFLHFLNLIPLKSH